jgi:hypothetical protein
MSWLLLLGLLAVVVCLPMLPALLEWARPSDAEPLHIDRHDALDPPYLATAFAAQLATAVLCRQPRLGPYEMALAPPFPEPWSLDAREQRKGRTRRAWHGERDLAAPDGVRFLAPVATKGKLKTAVNATYHSLWAGDLLILSAGSKVLRWAHGHTVLAQDGCQLIGRVTASQRLMVASDCDFTLLHAPAVQFGMLSGDAHVAPVHCWPGLPQTAQPDASGARAVCNEVLTVEAYRSWSVDLVCRDDLWLGDGCEAAGSIKAHGHLTLGNSCLIRGNLVAGKTLVLGAGCRVGGSIVAEGKIILGPGCIVGSPDGPATVSAPHIEVADGVVVHGTVWAGVKGTTSFKSDIIANDAPSNIVPMKPAQPYPHEQAA